MRLIFAKQSGILVPVNPEAQHYLDTLKADEGVGLDLKKVRNIRFHKKLFALLNLAFEMWEPDYDLRIDGICIRKDFERFREKVLILAGHFDAVYGLDGEVEFVAKSISFARVDDIEFAQIYKAVLDVVWKRILQPGRYPSLVAAEAVAMRLLGFD